MTDMESWLSSVNLPNVAEVLEFLKDDLGVETEDDLQLLEVNDLLPKVKLIQARKLVAGWKGATTEQGIYKYKNILNPVHLVTESTQSGSTFISNFLDRNSSYSENGLTIICINMCSTSNIADFIRLTINKLKQLLKKQR